MKLRQRIILILVLTTACLIFGLLQLSASGTMSSYMTLENREVKKNVSRVHSALRQRLQSLHEISNNWSNWDQAYDFMATKNQGFINTNLKTINFKVDSIIFVDKQKHIAFAKTVQRNTGVAPPNPEVLVSQLHFASSEEGKSPDSGSSIGFMLINNRPLAVSIRPILKSNRKGIQRGWLVFAVYLEEGDIADISAQTHVEVKMFSLSDKNSLPKEAIGAIPFLASANDIIARPIDDDKICGYTYLQDIHRKPIQLIETIEPREIFAQGQNETQFFIHIMVFAGIAFSLVVLFGVERSIVTRIAVLAENIDKIRAESDLTKRVKSTGSDEISDLSDKINDMLSVLQVSLAQLRESEDQLRVHSENLESTILERTQEIEHLAYHDKLTGLPNRVLLIDRIELALKNGLRTRRGTSVMFIDLDNFKLVNDSLGHSFGDQLLIEVTKILVDSVRPGDTVARIGGDEFTILLEDTDSVVAAEEVAHRILAALKHPIHLGSRETFAGASIGIAFSQQEDMDADTLLKHADTAMYRAKSTGKSNYVTYDKTMHGHAIERLELETSIRKALGNGEIFIEYQPIIDLNSGHMIGAEALARWNHPNRGPISPTVFIPIAEDTGLIVTIGYWILEQACFQAQSWRLQNSFSEFTLSVNLSGKQLQMKDVVQRIDRILLSTGLPPTHLKLEITESILMEDQEDIIEKMRQLKELGIQLALVDFGTGYSSLSTLRLFPIDTLKIDRAFISRLGEEENALPIVEAILGLAKTMGMTVTGEGVENQIQQDIIRRLGCQFGQGYFYDKPIKAEKLTKRIAKQNFEITGRTMPHAA